MTDPLSNLGTNALPSMGAPAIQPNAAKLAATRARAQQAIAGGDFSALMGLQRRSRELVARLTREAASHAAEKRDPARQAMAQQLEFQATQLRELAGAAGTSPKSNSRHALAWALHAIEQGGELTPQDAMRFRLAQRADSGGVAPAAGAVLRRAIDAITGAQSEVGKAAADPRVGGLPANLEMLQQRMRAINEASQALAAQISSGALDGTVLQRIDAAARQQNPGHVVRDVIAALKDSS